MQNILMVKMKEKIIGVNKSDIYSFTVSDGLQTYNFERVDLINPLQFFIVLAKADNKYALYKLIKTRFEKANYHTDGLMETGKPYNEYIDENSFYIVMPGSASFETVNLKTKSIKEVLKNDIDKVNTYFSQHKSETLNEDFLKNLITWLNQQ